MPRNSESLEESKVAIRAIQLRETFCTPKGQPPSLYFLHLPFAKKRALATVYIGSWGPFTVKLPSNSGKIVLSDASEAMSTALWAQEKSVRTARRRRTGECLTGWGSS